jgi:hypothetical protein
MHIIKVLRLNFFAGPIPIPFLGNLIQFANASDIPSLALAKFAKQYGEVFQLRLGLRTMGIHAYK